MQKYVQGSLLISITHKFICQTLPNHTLSSSCSILSAQSSWLRQTLRFRNHDKQCKIPYEWGKLSLGLVYNRTNTVLGLILSYLSSETVSSGLNHFPIQLSIDQFWTTLNDDSFELTLFSSHQPKQSFARPGTCRASLLSAVQSEQLG